MIIINTRQKIIFQCEKKDLPSNLIESNAPKVEIKSCKEESNRRRTRTLGLFGGEGGNYVINNYRIVM